MAATLINAWETLSKRNRGGHDYHSFGCSSISPPGFSSVRLSPLKILSSLLPSIAVFPGASPPALFYFCQDTSLVPVSLMLPEPTPLSEAPEQRIHP